MVPSFQSTVLSGVRPIALSLSNWHGAYHLVPYTANAVTSFSDPSPSERRHAGDRNALWCVPSPCITCLNNRQLDGIRRSFIVAILAALCIGTGNSLYSASASSLSRKLRSLSLRAILRQDSKSISYFRDARPLRVLYLSNAPQKIYGLAGVTLGTCVLFTSRHSHLYALTLVFSIVQAIATLTIGVIIGVIYIWKVGLLGLGIILIKIECT